MVAVEEGLGTEFHQATLALEQWEEECRVAVEKCRGGDLSKQLKYFFASPLADLTSATPSVVAAHAKLSTKLQQ